MRRESALSRCVYQPSDDTYMLLEAVEQLLQAIRPGEVKDIAELGSGSGIVTASLLGRLKHVRAIAIDLSPYAVAESSRNLGDCPRALVAECNAGECIASADLVVFNPPYLPPSEWDYLVDGGCGGWYLRSLVDPESMYRMCVEASRIARKAVVSVYSSISPVDIADCLRERGFTVKVLRKNKMFFEELITVAALRR